MIIHRTKKEYRPNILGHGLIPQYHKRRHYCPDLIGYISASLNFGYWYGEFRPGQYDYWEIKDTGYARCYDISRCKHCKKCDSAVVIFGSVPPEKLQLIARDDYLTLVEAV